MIALTDRRIVIITPPKTASTALHNALCPPGQFVVGHDRDGREVGKHLAFIHNEFRSFECYAIVRNPFDRVVSLYLDYCRVKSHFADDAPSFSRFVGQLPDLEVGTPGEWFWNWTLSRCLADAPRNSKIVKLEDFSTWLPTVGLNSLRRENTSFRRPWQAYYNQTLMDRVHALYKIDFEIYGYY